MRRFIYLDTDTLNSYLAQIFDGVIQKEDKETQTSKSKKRQNKFGGSLAGKISLMLFGKGVDTTAKATYEHLKTVENEEIVKDVQTKILHDNAFDQLMTYLDSQKLINKQPMQIGNFISIEDDFYIFDLAFYQKMFDEKGFMTCLEEIQNKNTQKEAEKKFKELSREQRRNKSTIKKLDEIIQDVTSENHDNFDVARMLIEMVAALIPYPQVLCIANYIVVLNQKYMRDSMETAAFKYGGKIRVVGYITNSVNSNANSKISAFAGVGKSINKTMKIFFENVDEMYVVHPVAIYYDN